MNASMTRFSEAAGSGVLSKLWVKNEYCKLHMALYNAMRG